MIFDEGHRLKNQNIKLVGEIKKMTRPIKVILTGTPLQNRLEELFNCIDIVNPGILGSLQMFKKVFGEVILRGLDKKCSLKEKELSKFRSQQLLEIVQKFILRRDSSIIQNYLPDKYEVLVFLEMTEIQEHVYEKIVNDA